MSIELQTIAVIIAIVLQTGTAFAAYGRLREEISELKTKVELLIDDKIK